MTWLASSGVAFLNGLFGILLGGIVGAGCVKWFGISSFEGAPGYAIVGSALLGGLVGFMAGLVVSRVVAVSENSGFGRSLLASCGSAVAIAAAISLICWLIGMGRTE